MLTAAVLLLAVKLAVRVCTGTLLLVCTSVAWYVAMIDALGGWIHPLTPLLRWFTAIDGAKSDEKTYRVSGLFDRKRKQQQY